MKPSLQEYYEDLVSQQPDSIRRFLERNGFDVFEEAAKWFSDSEKQFFINGYSNKVDIRAEYVFLKLRRRFLSSKKSQETTDKVKNEYIAPISLPLDIKLSFSNQYLLTERYYAIQQGLSPRAQKILQTHQLRGIEQLMPLLERKSDFLERFFGERRSKTRQEIEEMLDSLREYALLLQNSEEETNEDHTSNSIHNCSSNDSEVIQTEICNSNIQQSVNETSLQSIFQKLQQSLSVRAQNVLSANGLTTMERLEPWLSDKKKNFMQLRNCGSKTAEELNKMLSILNTFRGENAEKSIETEKPLALEDIISAVQDLIDGFMETASTRTINLMKHYHLCTADALLPYIYDKELHAPMQKHHAKMSKIYQEYTAFINRVRVFITDSSKGRLTPQDMVPLSNVVPLSNRDCDFAVHYKEMHGYWPMFSLLHKYFQYTKDKKEQLFADYSGFYGNALQCEELSIKYNLTQERVRQIIKDITSKPNPILSSFLLHKDWDNYPIRQRLFIGKDDYKNIKDIERIEGGEEYQYREENDVAGCTTSPVSFRDILILLQFHGFDCFWIDQSKSTISPYYTYEITEPSPILISNQFRHYRFGKAVREALRLSRLKTTNDISIPVQSYFVTNTEYWNKKEPLTDNLQSSLVFILCKLFALFGDIPIYNDQIKIKASTIDYPERIYEILKVAGRRLHTDEIYARLKDYCKECGVVCRYSEPSKIRIFLTSDERIVSVGKSSYWGLIEWGELIGSIRDIATKMVKRSKVPLQIEELAKEILVHRPDSALDNIITIIRQSVYLDDFVLFFDDYVGIKGRAYDEKYIVYPNSFDEWIETYRAFVRKNKRLPYGRQTSYEGYLYRWHYKASKLIDLSAEEILKFDILEKELAHYPQNATEYNFLQNCDLYKKFVESNKRMLTKDDDIELFNWFYKSSRSYSTYNDNRNKYFSQLLQSLSDILY